MTSTSNSQYKERGWIGIVLLAVGLSLAFLFGKFGKDSAWDPAIKTGMMALSYCTGMAGVAFLTSYKERRSFREMKSELLGMGTMLLSILLMGL